MRLFSVLESNRMPGVHVSAFLLTMLLIAAPALAGVVYEIEVKDHEQSPPKTESIQAAVEGRHLKMGIASGGRGEQGEMIFRGDRREMVVVNHEENSYIVMDQEAVQRVGGQVNDQLDAAYKQMQEALKDVPEDRRAMIEQMMKQKLPPSQPPARPKSELKKIGDRQTINGYPCVRYDVLRGGQKVRELWVTDWSNVEGGTDVVSAFEDMADFFNELMDSMPQFGQGGGPVGDPAFEHMREIGGFPVVTKEFDDDGSLEGESTLRSARRQTIDPDAFEPPSGYKRQEMFSPHH